MSASSANSPGASRPAMPAQACDCHVHVVGPPGQYPMLAQRQYTPGPASVQDLRKHLANCGLQRTVIIQPSFYGTDNRCTLDALDELQGVGRGVAVVDNTIGEDELRAMDARGIRGIRLNIESSHHGAPPNLAASIMPWQGRLEALGWHVQVFASLDLIATAAPGLAQLSVPLVLDHFAMVPGDCDENAPRLQALLHLLHQGKTWIKLSAPYRQPASAGAMSALRLARLFTGIRPDRLLWASDWPHTQRQAGKAALEQSAYRDIAAAQLLSDLEQWLPGPALRQMILVDNPARLYRF